MTRKAALCIAIVAGSLVVAVAAAEIYLRLSAPAQVKLPFYNHLYPYVMFRPLENASYVSQETFAMSHFKQRAWHYTNADGLRVPSPAAIAGGVCSISDARQVKLKERHHP